MQHHIEQSIQRFQHQRVQIEMNDYRVLHQCVGLELNEFLFSTATAIVRCVCVCEREREKVSEWRERTTIPTSTTSTPTTRYRHIDYNKDTCHCPVVAVQLGSKAFAAHPSLTIASRRKSPRISSTATSVFLSRISYPNSSTVLPHDKAEGWTMAYILYPYAPFSEALWIECFNTAAPSVMGSDPQPVTDTT